MVELGSVGGHPSMNGLAIIITLMLFDAVLVMFDCVQIATLMVS